MLTNFVHDLSFYLILNKYDVLQLSFSLIYLSYFTTNHANDHHLNTTTNRYSSDMMKIGLSATRTHGMSSSVLNDAKKGHTKALLNIKKKKKMRATLQSSLCILTVLGHLQEHPDSKAHGANMGGPRWAPCGPREPCYLGTDRLHLVRCVCGTRTWKC